MEESEWCLAYTPEHDEYPIEETYLLSWVIGILLGMLLVHFTM